MRIKALSMGPTECNKIHLHLAKNESINFFIFFLMGGTKGATINTEGPVLCCVFMCRTVRYPNHLKFRKLSNQQRTMKNGIYSPL